MPTFVLTRPTARVLTFEDPREAADAYSVAVAVAHRYVIHPTEVARVLRGVDVGKGLHSGHGQSIIRTA